MEVRSVDRAIDTLQALADARGPMSVVELQKVTGLMRPTLYRILQTLQKRNLILGLGEPLRFSLHYAVFQLGAAWSQSVDITAFGRPILEDLKERLGETVALFVPIETDRRICVLESVSNQTLTFSLGVGDIQSVTVGAAGKVLLAFLPEDEAAAVMKSVRGAEARSALEAQLDLARAQHGLVVMGEVMADGFGVASPVLGSGGRVCGSIALMGPHSRMKAESAELYLKEIKKAAQKLSTLLGYAPSSVRRRPHPAKS